MLFPVYLVNREIPEPGFFHSSDLESYNKLCFVKVKNEEEIKLHLCNLELPMWPYYFVIRENDDIVLKAKSMGFCCDFVLDLSLEDYIANIEIANFSPDEAVFPRDPPDHYQTEEKIRIYNQSEQNKIELDYVSYFSAESEKDAYMKELDQDQFCDRSFIYVEDGRSYIKCVEKTIDWKKEVKWCQPLLKKMFFDIHDNYEHEKYFQEFEINS
ncbi:BA75_03824T0 [Komagataella pastoris]|uniref:BA75_03824T0 n=1 Tax=Komagataella pastoris TaxID=4922 RepID=A0A1B2JFT4_PICPA|nr:BA75_03824T0 [Komagataella pastoris]